jgi:hypothetical protein
MQARTKNAAKIDISEGAGTASAQSLSMNPKPLRMGPHDGGLQEISVSNSTSLPKPGAYVHPFDAAGQSSLSITAQ